MPYIHHKLGRTFFQTRGEEGRGIPLVALHGGPGSTLDINKLLLRLGPQRKVYIYDQLGGGKSSRTPQSKWNWKTFVKELEILVNAWKLDRFHIFGISCGATLALEYYLATKDRRLQSIIFQSPFFSARDWQRDANLLISKLPTKQQKVIRACHEVGATDSAVYEKALEIYYLKHVIRNKTQFRMRRKRKNPGGKKIYKYMWGPSEFHASGTLRTYHRSPRLAEIRIPTLFISGQHDEAMPRTVKKYSEQVNGSKFCIIPKASHAIAKEQPRELLRTVRNYLRDVEERTSKPPTA